MSQKGSLLGMQIFSPVPPPKLIQRALWGIMSQQFIIPGGQCTWPSSSYFLKCWLHGAALCSTKIRHLEYLFKDSCPIPYTCWFISKSTRWFLTVRSENNVFQNCLGHLKVDLFWVPPPKIVGFPGGSDGKESASNAEDLGLIPGSGRSLGEGHGYPLQYSCLENSMDRGA